MSDFKITVFTPTYNRSSLLLDLYNSLINQTYKKFEWLIIDDGSTDDTQTVVERLINENLINIRYYKVDNGGKHRAINLAAEISLGDYIFIVDNDDTLTEDALYIGNSYLKNLTENDAGVVFRLKFKDGKKVGIDLPYLEKKDNYFNVRYNLGYNNDFKEFTKIDVLRQFKYPDYEGEKFCSEALVWNRISEKYNYLFVDKSIYICEYLDGGLSSGIIMNRRNSSSYAMEIYSDLFNNYRVPFKEKIKSGLNFWRFAYFNYKTIDQKLAMLDNKVMGLILYVPALLIILFDTIKIKNK